LGKLSPPLALFISRAFFLPFALSVISHAQKARPPKPRDIFFLKKTPCGAFYSVKKEFTQFLNGTVSIDTSIYAQWSMG
jgi:hypothetical protein